MVMPETGLLEEPTSPAPCTRGHRAEQEPGHDHDDRHAGSPDRQASAIAWVRPEERQRERARCRSAAPLHRRVLLGV